MTNEVENQSNFRCLLESICYAILVDFFMEKWKQVGIKLDSKSMYNSKCDFLKKTLFFRWKNCTFIGTQNQSKINQNMSSTSDGLLASIFEGFCSIFGPNLG